VQHDPVGFSAGDVNTFRYVGNHPILSRDPYGLAEVIEGGIFRVAFRTGKRLLRLDAGLAAVRLELLGLLSLPPAIQGRLADRIGYLFVLVQRASAEVAREERFLSYLISLYP
jgi:hypothetical protein